MVMMANVLLFQIHSATVEMDANVMLRLKRMTPTLAAFQKVCKPFLYCGTRNVKLSR